MEKIPQPSQPPRATEYAQQRIPEPPRATEYAQQRIPEPPSPRATEYAQQRIPVPPRATEYAQTAIPKGEAHWQEVHKNCIEKIIMKLNKHDFEKAYKDGSLEDFMIKCVRETLEQEKRESEIFRQELERKEAREAAQQTLEGGHNDYRQKYLKYKAKYLELKNSI